MKDFFELREGQEIDEISTSLLKRARDKASKNTVDARNSATKNTKKHLKDPEGGHGINALKDYDKADKSRRQKKHFDKALKKRGANESVELEERKEPVKVPRAVFDKLKKGSLIDLDWDGSMSSGAGAFKVVSKSRSAKYDVDKIKLAPTNGKKTVPFYLYSRKGGDATLAIGDMGASLTKYKVVKESVELDEVDMGQAQRGMRRQSKPTGSGYRVVHTKTGKIISTHDSQSGAMRVALRNDDYKVERIREGVEEAVQLEESPKVGDKTKYQGSPAKITHVDKKRQAVKAEVLSGKHKGQIVSFGFDELEEKRLAVTPDQIEKILVKRGNNPKDAKAMVKKHGKYVMDKYWNSSPSKMAEVISSLSETYGESVKTEDKGQFIYAAKQAKAKGDSTFVFAGKTYNCEEVLDELSAKLLDKAAKKADDESDKAHHAKNRGRAGKKYDQATKFHKGAKDARRRAIKRGEKVYESVELEESAWTPQQVKAVAKLDKEFASMLAKKGINPTSQEASKLWSANFKKRMNDIFESVELTEKNTIDIAREIIKTKSAKHGLDMQSANLILKVYDMVNDKNKKKMETMSPSALGRAIWKIYAKLQGK